MLMMFNVQVDNVMRSEIRSLTNCFDKALASLGGLSALDELDASVASEAMDNAIDGLVQYFEKIMLHVPHVLYASCVSYGFYALHVFRECLLCRCRGFIRSLCLVDVLVISCLVFCIESTSFFIVCFCHVTFNVGSVIASIVVYWS